MRDSKDFGDRMDSKDGSDLNLEAEKKGPIGSLNTNNIG